MKTKTIFVACIALISLFNFGCKKDEVAAPVDARDAFVGNYSEVYNGSMTIIIGGQPQTSPINSTATFFIEKAASENRIVRVDPDNSRYEGTVSGSHVQFDPMHMSGTQNGMTMSYISDVSGNMNGNVLNYTMSITGTVYYNGSSFPMTGNITSVATKKTGKKKSVCEDTPVNVIAGSVFSITKSIMNN